MFHYFETLTNTRGDSLASWQVEVVDLETGSVVDIFADESSTPIVTASGIANRAVTDEEGNFDFFVPSGTYSLQIYDPAGVFQLSQRYVPMYGDIAAEDLAEYQAIQNDVQSNADVAVSAKSDAEAALSATSDIAAEVAADKQVVTDLKADAETAALAAQAAGNYFADTTAGLAGTASGEYFFIPDGEGDLAFYLNDSGTATLIPDYSLPGLIPVKKEVIASSAGIVSEDASHNLLLRVDPDTIDHPNIERLMASTLLGIGSSRPLRAPSTPIATPIPLTGLTHLIKEGQSNSVNTGDALGLPAYDPPAMMFNGGVHSRRGYGDTETSATTGSRRTSLVPLRETGTETGMGPAMEMMLQLLREEDGVDLSTSDLQLLGSSVGVGGTKIEQIASTYYFRLEEDVAAAKALADADGRGYSVAGVLYNGHESNQLNTPPTLAGAMVPTTEANYLAVQREFRAQIEATVQAASGQTWPVPMFIVQTNTHLSSASANYYNENAYVAKAQLAAGLNADGVDPNIFFCGPTYQFALAADGVHFTSIGGAVRDALLGIAMKRVFFDGVKPKLLVPDMTIHANTTRLTFPEGPFNLRWDTTTVPEQEDYGIWMFDDAGARQSIPAPRLVDRNVVEIGRVALSGYRIANAMGTTTGGTRGLSNLRDNQGDRIVFAPGRFNHPMHNWVPLFERIVE